MINLDSQNKSVEVYIRPDLVCLDFNAADAQQVIYKLAGMLADSGAVLSEYGQAAWEREMNFPTGLPTEGIYVALPHADPQGVLFDAVAMVICTPPVTFRNMANPIQELPVEIAIMAVVSEGDRQVNMLKALAEVLGEPENLLSLRNSHTSEEAANLLSRFLLCT